MEEVPRERFLVYAWRSNHVPSMENELLGSYDSYEEALQKFRVEASYERTVRIYDQILGRNMMHSHPDWTPKPK